MKPDRRTRLYKQSRTIWSAVIALLILAIAIGYFSIKRETKIQPQPEKPRVVHEWTQAEIDKFNCEWNTPCPTATPKPTINPLSFFKTLRKKESSNGRNTNPLALHNICARKGMWNEIGYNPQAKYCFKSREEALLFVTRYIDRNCKGKTQAQCECYWNTGLKSKSCAYSEGHLSLAN